MDKNTKTITAKLLLLLVLTSTLLLPLNIGSINAVTKGEASSICGGGDTDIKGSLILSIITGCLPGIIEKAKQWKEIRCEEIQCTYDAVVNLQIDPGFCKKQGAYQTCSFIVGEIFALPPMSMIEDFRQSIANIVANPIGSLFGYAAKISRQYISGACAPGGAALVWTCNVADNIPVGYHLVFLTVTDIAALVQQIKDIISSAEGMFSQSTDVCDSIDEIITEMKQIQNTRLGIPPEDAVIDEEKSGGLFSGIFS